MTIYMYNGVRLGEPISVILIGPYSAQLLTQRGSYLVPHDLT